MNYEVLKEKCMENNLGYTYGIRAVESGKILASVSDISTDIAFVENMCERFNKYGLSPIHLKDAIEDLLVK